MKSYKDLNKGRNPGKSQEIQNELTAGKSRLELVENFVRVLLDLQNRMDLIVDIKLKYQRVLYEPQLLFSYRKEFLGFLAGLKLYNQILRFGTNNIRGYLDKIKQYDYGLAIEIERALPRVKSEDPLFSELISFIGQSRMDGYKNLSGYVRSNLDELLAKARSIRNKKISRKLAVLFVAVSGREIVYLGRYATECENWFNPRYSIGKDAPHYIGIVNLFIRGGAYNNSRYMGLLNDFGDEELVKMLLRNPKVKNLWRYKEQVMFLLKLIDLCKKSETPEGLEKWEGFYGKNSFWGNQGDERGRNFDRYVDLLESKFGNSDFADILRSQKYHIGEDPEGWGGRWEGNQLIKPGFLNQLLARIQHPTYQRQKIISPAAGEIIKLFGSRAKTLGYDLTDSVNSLIDIIKTISGSTSDLNTILSKIRSVLVRKRRVMLNKLLDDCTELGSKMQEPMTEYDSYSKEVENDRTMAKIDPNNVRKEIIKWLDARKSRAVFLSGSITRGEVTRNLQSFAKAMRSDTIVSKSSLQVHRLGNYEHINEKDIQEIQLWIARSQLIFRKLSLLYEYIKSKILQEFAIGDFEKADIREAIKNPDFNFRIIRKSVNRVAAAHGVAIFIGTEVLERAA